MARTGNQTWNIASNVSPDATDTPTGPIAKPAPTRRTRRPRKKGRVMRLVKRLWIPLVVVLVVALAAFCVHRLHGVFGRMELTRPGAGLVNDPEPFNPKVVKYEIWGEPGAVTTINYLDLDAQPQEVRDVPLPWELTLTTTDPATSPNIVAQGDGSTISCRITVDGVVKDVRTTTGVNAETFCLVKSA